MIVGVSDLGKLTLAHKVYNYVIAGLGKLAYLHSHIFATMRSVRAMNYEYSKAQSDTCSLSV